MKNLKLVKMSDVKTEQVEWILDGRIPLGKITVIQGDPGCGKTTFALAIAAALTNGDELPGGTRHEPADVIFQSSEDGYGDTIKPRLESFGADCSRVSYIDNSEDALSFSDERIEAAINEVGAKMLVCDPAQSFFTGTNMNSADGVRPMMKSLAGVAERTGCAIVIIGHLRKSSGKSSYRGLGSIDIYAAARSVLVVGKGNENIRIVVQDKNNLAPISKSLSFELDPETGFNWLGECDINVDDVMSDRPKRESQNDKALRIIKTELADGCEVAASDIFDVAYVEGVSEVTLKRAKSELNVTSIKRGNQWFWCLPIDADFVEIEPYQERVSTHSTSLIPLMITENREVLV